ncbi:MAG: STAS domain-containing protein [Candidatus Kryptoniota bacterium]
MKEKTDSKLTVRIAASIPKALHSRDSADRLVRTVVSLWRARPDVRKKTPTTLILDFQGVEQLSESAAGTLLEFRREFSEDKNPAIEFSNMSVSVNETFAAVEKPVGRFSRRVKTQKKKKNIFAIEI